ncbi:hypothetical protein TNIN_128771 [Trichonephila inaurata madagascariensis]|uniref:MYND-type domain-containing protein n=1 Tax=Trichonephila inaurata madagascariensis TaxID=2747483 RepID=A0A8X7C875_9ARAC|nr:hypothetical protein TNIN_128771 [Trichonephila inaurata madagascariensis]
MRLLAGGIRSTPIAAVELQTGLESLCDCRWRKTLDETTLRKKNILSHYLVAVEIIENTKNTITPSSVLKSIPEDSTLEMSCAVCKKTATLRCKQCAKVSYCNTACAKTYWHSKHKMECKLMSE